VATQPTLFAFPAAQLPEAAVVHTPAPAIGNSQTGGLAKAVTIEDPGLDIARKTVCIKVRLSTMGNTRKVSTSQIEADADKALLRVSKFLLDSAELKAIRQFDGEVRQYLYNICLPFEIGIHLLPIAALQTVENRLRQFAVDRVQLIDAFLVAYPSLCQDAAQRLRGLYNPADYPPIDEVRQQFSLSWQYISFGVPEQLKGISRDVWEQEREKAAQRMAQASSEIQQVLRETMAGLVQHMADRLQTSEDGKPLRFKNSTVSNLVEFLANFEFRNVTDDTELQNLVAQARQMLQGVDAEDLRSTGELRTKVQQGMTNLAAQLDTLVVRAGGRKFRFDEEES
jgi:hypothetical protein